MVSRLCDLGAPSTRRDICSLDAGFSPSDAPAFSLGPQARLHEPHGAGRTSGVDCLARGQHNTRASDIRIGVRSAPPTLCTRQSNARLGSGADRDTRGGVVRSRGGSPAAAPGSGRTPTAQLFTAAGWSGRLFGHRTKKLAHSGDVVDWAMRFSAEMSGKWWLVRAGCSRSCVRSPLTAKAPSSSTSGLQSIAEMQKKPLVS